MTKYKSKIGLGLVIFLSFILGGSAAIMIYEKIWLGFFLNMLVTVFVIYLLLNTFYVINDAVLEIKCGFLYAKAINIKTIYKIEETNNPISSPATSLDRLELFYDEFDSVLISPKDKAKFTSHLKTINPEIEFILLS